MCGITGFWASKHFTSGHRAVHGLRTTPVERGRARSWEESRFASGVPVKTTTSGLSRTGWAAAGFQARTT